MVSLFLADVVPLTLTTVTFPSFHPFAGQTGIVNAFAIRHPEGVVLVDTGIGEGNAFVDQSYRPLRRSIADQLRAVDLAITDVVAVINGHLHFDNIGGNALFPGIPIFVHQAEWDAAHAGGDTYRNERVDFDVLDWIDFPGADYRRVDGEYEVVPGVRLFPTPGHTLGHQAVVIETTRERQSSPARCPTTMWSGSGFASKARCSKALRKTWWSVIPRPTSYQPFASSSSVLVTFISPTTPSRGDSATSFRSLQRRGARNDESSAAARVSPLRGIYGRENAVIARRAVSTAPSGAVDLSDKNIR